MDKRILKEIAKRWCKGILLASDITDSETMDLISEDEQEFILKEVALIAERITDKPTPIDLNKLIKEYYEF